MGKATGFLEYARQENPYRDESKRLGDFDDLHLPQPAEARRCQAARCMGCGVPFCQSDFGCPLHNLIPEWNDLLYQGQERLALERLLQTAPFPEFTGRVCPALCEKACNLADEGVTNRDNELYLIETGFEKGWIAPRIPAKRTGKRVAVIGSGPAGLAAADLLNQMGHAVTVVERADRPGGLLTYGIPNMKLPKTVVERRIRLMEAEGVSFLLNTEAGPEITREFDAVLLCGGARNAPPFIYLTITLFQRNANAAAPTTEGRLKNVTLRHSVAARFDHVAGDGIDPRDFVRFVNQQITEVVTTLDPEPADDAWDTGRRIAPDVLETVPEDLAFLDGKDDQANVVFVYGAAGSFEGYPAVAVGNGNGRFYIRPRKTGKMFHGPYRAFALSGYGGIARIAEIVSPVQALRRDSEILEIQMFVVTDDLLADPAVGIGAFADHLGRGRIRAGRDQDASAGRNDERGQPRGPHRLPRVFTGMQAAFFHGRRPLIWQFMPRHDVTIFSKTTAFLLIENGYQKAINGIVGRKRKESILLPPT